jgi:hypothetical protein
LGSLLAELESFEPVGDPFADAEGAVPLLLMPFWTGLLAARPVTGLTEVRDHAEGLTERKARIVSNKGD